MDLNPRNFRDKLAPHLGKRLMIGTTDWHYISGTLESIDEAGQLHLSVAGAKVTVPCDKVATFQEAPPQQAEYFK